VSDPPGTPRADRQRPSAPSRALRIAFIVPPLIALVVLLISVRTPVGPSASLVVVPSFDGPRAAAFAGAAWVVSRLWYAIAYAADPRRRGPGFVGGMIAWLALMGMAAWGIVRVALA